MGLQLLPSMQCPALMVTCAYHGGPIEHDGDRWVDTRSGDDGGTFDWCPDSPMITDNEPLQPHKPGKASS